MTDRELFLLHPVAWHHAQMILDEESSMLRNGRGRKKRLQYLQIELQRFLERAEVVVADAVTNILSELSIKEMVIDLDVMRTRFESLGFSGTLRQIRNLNRRIGAQVMGMDQTTFWGGCLVLTEHEEFRRDFESLFRRLIEQLLSNPAVVDAEHQYDAIMARNELLSVRDHDAKQLAINVFGNILANSSEEYAFSAHEVRLFVKLYCQVLDVPFVDIVVALINHGGMADVRKMFLQSVEESTEVYSQVLSAAVERRIDSLQFINELRTSTHVPQLSSEATPTEPTPDRCLLSRDDVLVQLKISRTTLYRLERDGHLNSIRIGRSKRYEQAVIDRYLGRK